MTLHSLRISDSVWIDEKSFQALMELLDKYPHCVDQISLFTAMTHTPLPLGTMRERAGLLKERIRVVKEAGYDCGINLLSTIGHHEEDLESMFQGDYDRMTDCTGKVCRGSFCLFDERYHRDYIIPVYRMLAEAGPDYIWVDDDVRYGHAPAGAGCFCNHCLEAFNEIRHAHYSREELVAALRENDFGLRKAWLDFNSFKIGKLLEIIRKTVETVSSSIGLGFMSGSRFYEGYDFARWADALTDHGKITAMWRPGGGVYTDFDADELLFKSEYIGIQSSLLPDYVKIVQAEIENFPYQMQKSPRATALEGILYMTSGCTGAAFNVLPGESKEPVQNGEPMIRAIAETGGFARRLSDALRDTAICGVHAGWNRYSSIGGHGPLEFDGSEIAAAPRELFRLGIPQAFKMEEASCCILTGDAPYTMEKEKLLGLLKGGLFVDACAVRALNELGLGEYVGFQAGKAHPVDCREKYSDHPLNGEIAGRIRNCRQSFYPGESIELLPSPEAEVLSSAVDYHDRLMYPCAMGLYRNKLGGIVCASGYYPFKLITDGNKAMQLKRIFRLLSKDTLPGYLEPFYRARLTAHRKADGQMVWTLFNHNLDVGRDLSLILRTEKQNLYLTDMELRTVLLETEELNHGYRRAVLPDVKPWELVLIEEGQD